MYRGMKGITDSGLSIAVQLVDLKTGKYFKNKTTIAAADRNNKEKDASDKSEPQAEFKRIEYDGGDVYEGETRNGKRHGKGKYTWADGDTYEGEWKDDRKDGNGKQSHPDGSCYGGGWKDDKMDGYGVFVYSNQSRYEGHWSEGTENGHGIMKYIQCRCL